MPTRWAIANGNWSSLSTWNDSGSLGFPTASDDIFANTFTVNVDTSFQALTLNSTARARDIAIPIMTSDSTPNPYNAAVSSNTSTFGASAAFQVFDRNSSTIWAANAATGWVSIDVGTGNSVVIDGYTVFGSPTTAANPRNWTFEGSNDNVNWTVLQTVTLGASISSNGSNVQSSIGNTTAYRYYRLNISLNGGFSNVFVAGLELYQPRTAALAAGGSFIFNSGSISGSVTSTSPLSAGATNLITVTATTGSVGLTLGGNVQPRAITSDVLISHSGNCDLILTGSNFIANGVGSTTNTIYCINKSSAGTIRILGNLIGTPGTSNTFNTAALISSAGNTVIQGDVAGSLLTTTNNDNVGINQTGGNLTIIGNVTGGGGTGGGTARGVNFTGTSIRVIGNIIGGPTSAGINTTAPIFVTGNVTGSAAAGITTTTAPIIVNGNVVAQGGAPAINISGPTVPVFVNVSGSVISSAAANAIVIAASTPAASSVVNLAGNMVNTSGKTAIYCQNLFLSNTDTTTAQFVTIGSQDRTLYSADTFPNLPSASDVRFGTTYGPGSGNTGTLRMASPQDVRSGVLVGNTTGSAILSMESLSNEVQTSSDPFAQRLRDIPTVDIIGNLLTAFKK